MRREERVISAPRPFEKGFNELIASDSQGTDMHMDFGLHRLDRGMTVTSEEAMERAFLLIEGNVLFQWGGRQAEARRSSVFREGPWCLHLPSGAKASFQALCSETVVAEVKTRGNGSFHPSLRRPVDCPVQRVGEGLMQNTAIRSMRSIVTPQENPAMNLVMGEVINGPGRYSAYPPHHHPQPELYHYRFHPEQGYGYCEMGDDVYKVRHMDTAAIPGGLVHPQTAAPGYAMYYLFVIRHLDDQRFSEAAYLREHQWLLKPEAEIWDPRELI